MNKDSKASFGSKLRELMESHGWNQSELARRANLPRDSISTYIRGRTVPSRRSIVALASAFGVEAHELGISDNRRQTTDPSPLLEVKVLQSSPTKANVRVDCVVTLATATKIIELIEKDSSS